MGLVLTVGLIEIQLEFTHGFDGIVRSRAS